MTQPYFHLPSSILTTRKTKIFIKGLKGVSLGDISPHKRRYLVNLSPPPKKNSNDYVELDCEHVLNFIKISKISNVLFITSNS